MDNKHANAVWFAGPRTVELRTEEVPPPRAGDVQVQAIASGVSQGTEMLVYRGLIPANMPLDLPTFSGSYDFPIKYGYACVGRVLEVGTGVEDVAAGERVFALHPHQTVFNAPRHVLAKLPPDLAPELGVFSANLETALNITHDTPIKLGETALVVGQGVVGLLAAQCLRRAGAQRVFAVDPLPLRQELAQHVGVDAVFAPSADLLEQIRAANNGRLADVVVEASGNPAALQTAIECVMDEGTVVVASWYGAKPVALELGGRFHRGRITLRSSQVGHLNPALGLRWDYARRFETATTLLSQLHLHELITHRFPLTEAAHAYALVDQRAGECGQVVLLYDNVG